MCLYVNTGGEAKGVRLSEAGGIDSCEPTAVDVRNQTQVLFNR